MLNIDSWCFLFQIWDQTEGTGQTCKEGQLISLYLPNVHFFPYLVDKRGVLGSYTLKSHKIVSKCHDTHNAMHFCCVFIAISRKQHPATHSTFSRWILLEKAVRLKHDIFCNARDNKTNINSNTQHFDISGTSTKPTQNQVYSRQNHKTNSESSVFNPKSQNQLRIKCIQAKISITYQKQKKADIKNNTPAADTLAK